MNRCGHRAPSDGPQRRWTLKIRGTVLPASSALFTFALLMVTPAIGRAAATGCQSGPWDAGPLYTFHDCFAPAGFASLTVILIGLIVAWTGYIKGVLWTWLVMFVIVWVWMFPVLVLPYFRYWNGAGSAAETLADAIHESGMARAFVEDLLAFVLMVVALVLPVKTFVVSLGVVRKRPRARS